MFADRVFSGDKQNIIIAFSFIVSRRALSSILFLKKYNPCCANLLAKQRISGEKLVLVNK